MFGRSLHRFGIQLFLHYLEPRFVGRLKFCQFDFTFGGDGLKRPRLFIHRLGQRFKLSLLACHQRGQLLAGFYFLVCIGQFGL